MNTTANLLRYSMNTLFIKYMKYAGALIKPKDITVNSYNPYLDVNVVLGISLRTGESEDRWMVASGCDE
jgi:hypothetical protein